MAMGLPLAKKETDDDSKLINFALALIRAACEATSTVGLEFPEDLGSALAGDPASLWQLAACQQLQELGAVRGAFSSASGPRRTS